MHLWMNPKGTFSSLKKCRLLTSHVFHVHHAFTLECQINRGGVEILIIGCAGWKFQTNCLSVFDHFNLKGLINEAGMGGIKNYVFVVNLKKRI